MSARGPVPGSNVPTPPPAAGARTVSVAAATVQLVTQALGRALRLSMSHDAIAASLDSADTPSPSPLSKQLSAALKAMSGQAEVSPAERVDTHTFQLDNLNEGFVRQLMLERGWQQASLMVGSAQGEALARRMLHTAAPDSRLKEQINLLPLSGGHRVEQMDGWTLVEFVES